MILLMEENLHLFTSSLSQYLHGFVLRTVQDFFHQTTADNEDLYDDKHHTIILIPITGMPKHDNDSQQHHDNQI